MLIEEKESNVQGKELMVDFSFNRPAKSEFKKEIDFVKVASGATVDFSAIKNYKKLAESEEVYAGSKMSYDLSTFAKGVWQEFKEKNEELKLEIWKTGGVKAFDVEKERDLQHVEALIEEIETGKNGIEIVARTFIKRLEDFSKHEKDRVIDILKTKEESYTYLFGRPIRVKVSEDEGDFGWSLVSVDKGRQVTGEEIYAKWSEILSEEVDNWMKHKVNNPFGDLLDDVKAAIQTGKRMESEDLSMSVSEFIRAKSELLAIDGELRISKGSDSFFYTNSKIGSRVKGIMNKMDDYSEQIEKALEKIVKLIPDFTTESLMAMNNINFRDFITKPPMEIVTKSLTGESNVGDIPDTDYISSKTLKKINPAKLKRAIDAAELSFVNGLEDSKHLLNIHTAILKYDGKYDVVDTKKTHLIVGISTEYDRWSIGPLLNHFCDSKKFKISEHSMLVEVDLSENGVDSRVVCAVDLDVEWLTARKFK